MFTETEEIMGVMIHYDAYVKRDLAEVGAWIPLSYEIARSCFNFINVNFYTEREKPILSVVLQHDRAAYGRAIELHVRIKETGYGEAELFTMDIFDRYPDRHTPTEMIKQFMKRFESNILRSAVLEKIELYRNPPKPIVDWFTIKMTGLALGRSALKLARVITPLLHSA